MNDKDTPVVWSVSGRAVPKAETTSTRAAMEWRPTRGEDPAGITCKTMDRRDENRFRNTGSDESRK